MADDLVIRATIPEADKADFVAAWLAALPKPTDFEGNDQKWIKHCVRRHIMTTYKNGKAILSACASSDNLFSDLD